LGQAARLERECLEKWETSVATGVVKWFNPVVGYGMVQPDDGSPAVLVDSEAVERAGLAMLRRGQRVAFDVVFEHRRNLARNLKLLETAESEGAAARP
jgi:cold shock protein